MATNYARRNGRVANVSRRSLVTRLLRPCDGASEHHLTSYKYTKQRAFGKWTLAIAVCIAILLSSLFYVLREVAKPLCKEVTEYLTLQICALDFLLEDNKLLVDAWSKIDTNDKEKELNRVIKVVRSNIEGYKSAIEHKLELSSCQDFLLSLYGTNATAMVVMEKATEMIFDDIEKDMNLMQNIASNKNISPSKKEYVKHSLSLLKPSCESHFYSYLQILNEFPESALEGYNQLATRWVNMPHTGLGLASSEYDKFVERNDKIIQEELAKMNKINLDIQDKVYEQEQKLDSLN